MTDENTTDTNYYDLSCYEEVEKFRFLDIPQFFISVFVLSCICNILVLVFLALLKSLKSVINIFILNLTLSNLLLIFELLFSALYIWGEIFGEVGLKAIIFLFYVGFYSSVLFLTLMTVQRYMAVVHPLSDWKKSRCFSVAPFIIWILSGTVALLITIDSKFITEFEYSVEWISAIFYFQNAFFFIAFLIMFFCYGRMFWTIRKSQTNKRHKTVRLTFFIALVFFISWAPYNIVKFLSWTFDQFIKCEESKRLYYAAYYAYRMMAFSQCCISPAILVFVHARFRNNRFEQIQGDFV
ncbi:chemokine XC receptor 1-like [Garra rufa]|uniref:chemokine XC receptor 1-like n=1 Tax=Garra rufa TaxID=137080 RepID=UPI003CCEC938